jgi:hypothetical protein
MLKFQGNHTIWGRSHILLKLTPINMQWLYLFGGIYPYYPYYIIENTSNPPLLLTATFMFDVCDSQQLNHQNQI